MSLYHYEKLKLARKLPDFAWLMCLKKIILVFNKSFFLISFMFHCHISYLMWEGEIDVFNSYLWVYHYEKLKLAKKLHDFDWLMHEKKYFGFQMSITSESFIQFEWNFPLYTKVDLLYIFLIRPSLLFTWYGVYGPLFFRFHLLYLWNQILQSKSG